MTSSSSSNTSLSAAWITSTPRVSALPRRGNAATDVNSRSGVVMRSTSGSLSPVTYWVCPR